MQTSPTKTGNIQTKLTRWICCKCGGPVNPDRVQTYPRTEIWEWSCLHCGKTTYEDRSRKNGLNQAKNMG